MRHLFIQERNKSVNEHGISYKVQIYLAYHCSVSHLVLIGNQRRGGHTLLQEMVGGSQFGRLEEKPSTLSTLWYM